MINALGDEIPELAELSLDSKAGLSSTRTIKLRGSIKGQEVVILIDSGASHSFVSTGVVQHIGLQFSSTKGYGVLMGQCILLWPVKVFVERWS